MFDLFERTALSFGSENMQKLADSRVLVFGLGGVGGFVVEALVRSGIGAIDIVDDDTVCLSNINRQIYALHSTLGRAKVDVAAERIFDINPDCIVTRHNMFFVPETADRIDFSPFDYVVDCIDTVSGKIEIVSRAKALGKPVISCMGAGNKVFPSEFKVCDISRTSVCPLARVMRNELKKRGIRGVKCVFSTEKSVPVRERIFSANGKKLVPGSNAFTPSVAGLLIAGEVVRDLTGFMANEK